MKASEGGAAVLRFGPFTVDAAARELRHGSVRVGVTARQFDVLVCLASRAGTTVSKDTLFAEVWAGIPVEENTLAQAISALRRQLRRASGAGDYIITVPGKGYQLVVPSIDEAAAIPEQAAAGPRTSMPAVVGALIVVAAIVLASRVFSIHALHLNEERCVAVIPFQTFGDSPIAGAALAEALTGRLASNDRMRIRPTFAAAAVAPDAGIRALGARLKVDRIVSGSMRMQHGGGARIQVELVDVNREAAVWSGTFDQLPGDARSDVVLNEIADAVRSRLVRTP